MRISELHRSNPKPSPTEIEAVLVNLSQGSITHVMLDKDRKPVDLWGTPFRIFRDVKGERQTVVTTSAGPDRQLETEDDVRYSMTSATR